MDFTNFAGIEFAHAVEAQHELERNQKKWLFQWQDLRRAADDRLATAKAQQKSAKADTRRAA